MDLSSSAMMVVVVVADAVGFALECFELREVGVGTSAAFVKEADCALLRFARMDPSVVNRSDFAHAERIRAVRSSLLLTSILGDADRIGVLVDLVGCLVPPLDEGRSVVDLVDRLL